MAAHVRFDITNTYIQSEGPLEIAEEVGSARWNFLGWSYLSLDYSYAEPDDDRQTFIGKRAPIR